MSTPTREQVIEWAREANFDVSTLNSIDGEEAQCDSCKVILTDQLQRLCTLAMSSGRDQGLREAKEVCEREAEGFGGIASGPFATDFGKHTHNAMAAGAKNCAAAIDRARTTHKDN